MAAGIPKRQIMVLKTKFCALAEVIVEDDSASIHLVK
jgi:hypothetical protein